jgi:hypothetical protein
MHIFNMFKIRHSHREYDTRGQAQLSQSGAGQPHLLGRSMLAPFQIPLCQHVKEGRCTEYPMPKVGAAMQLCRLATLASQSA